MRHVKTPIIVLGYDYNASKDGIGGGTWSRCEQAQSLYLRLSAHNVGPFLIMSPGQAPEVSTSAQGQTMAQMMRQWFMEESVLSDPEIVSNPDIRLGNQVWGTRAELEEAVRIIRQEEENNDIWEAYVVSHPEHLLRVRILTNHLTRKLNLNWRWGFVRTSTPKWSGREVLKEYTKALIEIFRGYIWHPQL